MTAQLELKNLNVHFPIRGGTFGRQIGAVRAVNDVSFTVRRGETLGLVGESGCGKSTLGKAILRLVKITSGSIFFENQNLTNLTREEIQPLRRKIQMIFQDPYSSLNPRLKVRDILSEPFEIHERLTRSERNKKVLELLHIVGLRPEFVEKYPHEFSGGQRQRIGIARALAVRPELIVADEPVSALDVSIQAQILNLLKSLQAEFKLTYLFISHDLNVIRYLCDRVVVMYLGRVMEVLTREQLLDPTFPKHPYTEALIAAAPKRHPNDRRERPPLQGDIPSPARPPAGCVFHTRCPEAQPICRAEIPVLKSPNHAEHLTACHFRG
jgi:oligopeptide transport system ATP-binding protein